MVESSAVGSRWWCDGGLLASCLAAFVGVDFPRVVRVVEGPFGGEGEVLGDGLAEIVGDLSDEPSVELVALAYRVGGRPLDPPVRVCDLLLVLRRVSAGCV